MNEFTKRILKDYQVRKTRKQKDDFLRFLVPFAKENGYDMKIEKGSLGSKNAVFGNIETAKVIYTAHYDTCAWMPIPNFITPMNIAVYLLYQLVLTFVIFAVAFGVSVVFSLINEDFAPVAGLLSVYVMIGLLMAGPANKHTANDNTSGVITVLELMKSMPAEMRSKAAFVLFDFEEIGLVGSSSFQSGHKKLMKDKLVINFDCVSDGKDMLFAVKKKAKAFVPKLNEAFESGGQFTSHIKSKGVFYPSDQASFNLGVGVAALKKTKNGLLYMDRIHTHKDTVFEEENIEYFVNGAIKFTEII